ncbi:MAG TPA: hypothetical protein PLL75_02155 [Candidatus Omnitrophota bacterium]|nr:hypothetical protein [Candidatus Omnitrophota bacterium]
MNPSVYGELALGLTVAVLIGQIIMGPLSNGVTRFYAPAVEQRDVGGYLNAVRRWMLLATAAIFLISLFVVLSLFIAGRKEWIAIAIAAFIFSVFNGYNLILNGIQNAARQRSVVALHQGMQPWARLLVAAGLIVLFGATSAVAMTGYVLGVVLVLGSQYVFFYKMIYSNRAVAENGKNWTTEIGKYSGPFAAWGLFTWAQLASDRWALGFFSTTHNVGVYAVLYQLGYYPISIVTDMALQFLAPILYKRTGDATDCRRNAHVSRLSWRLTVWAMGVTGVSFLLTFLFHVQIFRIFVAQDYNSVSYLFPWMILSGGLFAAGQALTLSLMSRMRTQIMTTAKIVTALLGVSFNFLGAYLFGVAGVVFAGVVFSGLYFAWMIALSKSTGEREVLA